MPVEVRAKLALGTAQFGLRYGVANASGQVDPAEVEAILRLARNAAVDTLDTAIAYGDSEECLGRAGVASWRVTTKLPPLPKDVVEVGVWIDEQISGSLRRLRIAQLEAVLLHRPADLLGRYGVAYRQSLDRIKSAGLTRAVGVSIYDPAELSAMWETWRPDIVQAPCNVLDRRLLHSSWLPKLQEAGVRIHARSAFLQGLLLMPVQRRPAWFRPWDELLERWFAWCRDNELAPLHAALSFVRAQQGIECVVVGVDSVAQLRELLTETSVFSSPPDDMFSTDRGLIEPSQWKLT